MLSIISLLFFSPQSPKTLSMFELTISFDLIKGPIKLNILANIFLEYFKPIILINRKKM